MFPPFMITPGISRHVAPLSHDTCVCVCTRAFSQAWAEVKGLLKRRHGMRGEELPGFFISAAVASVKKKNLRGYFRHAGVKVNVDDDEDAEVVAAAAHWQLNQGLMLARRAAKKA